MSGSHFYYVPAKYSRSNDPGFHGGHSVREIVASQKAHTDATVQPQRRDLPERRSPLPHVPSGRHAEVAYRGGTRQGAAHQEEGTYHDHHIVTDIVYRVYGVVLSCRWQEVQMCWECHWRDFLWWLSWFSGLVSCSVLLIELSYCDSVESRLPSTFLLNHYPGYAGEAQSALILCGAHINFSNGQSLSSHPVYVGYSLHTSASVTMHQPNYIQILYNFTERFQGCSHLRLYCNCELEAGFGRATSLRRQSSQFAVIWHRRIMHKEDATQNKVNWSCPGH